MSDLWLPYDPPSLARTAPAPRMFDPAPHRNRGRRGVSKSTPEWDNRLIATAVALGMPREVAEQARVYPPARYDLLVIWTLVQDAAEGDKKAKAALDRMRYAWKHGQDVTEILDAMEQPAQGSELKELVTGDK